MKNYLKSYSNGEDIALYQPGDFSHRSIETARLLGPKVTVIGGGTGLSTLLKGLKSFTENITAIVAVSDDGGGSGVLRNEMGMLPPGDIRNCILALANAESTMAQVLGYRFTDGSLSGQSFGNLFLAALNGICGSFDEAVKLMCEVLAITGRVLPVTTTDVNLRAVFENGSEVIGESKISVFKKKQRCRIKYIDLVPNTAEPLPDALDAIRGADMIVLGPGSLYTSVIPNLLVRGVPEAIVESKALKVYTCNVMTQIGETEGYTAFEHLTALYVHSNRKIADICLVNNAEIPADLVENYRLEYAAPVVVDSKNFESSGVELCEFDLISTMKNYARHDPKKLATALMRIHARHNPRPGIFGRYDRMMLEQTVE